MFTSSDGEPPATNTISSINLLPWDPPYGFIAPLYAGWPPSLPTYSITCSCVCSDLRTRMACPNYEVVRIETGVLQSGFQPRTVANLALKTPGAQHSLFKPDETNHHANDKR